MPNEEEGNEANDLPPLTAGSEIKWLGFFLSVEFYPGIKTTRQAGASFSSHLANVIEIERVELESNEWKFGGGGTCDGMQVFVEKQRISLGVNSPGNVEDFYKLRNELILEEFRKSFSPQVILRSSAMASGIIDVTGDARFFLASSLMLMHPKKLEAINRPLQILGVRMYFPPDDVVDWGIDVKAES